MSFPGMHQAITVHCFFSQENGAFFVMTNMIITPDQMQGTCPEDPGLSGVKCTKDSDCSAREPVKYGHGKFSTNRDAITKMMKVWEISNFDTSQSTFNMFFPKFLHIQNICSIQYDRFQFQSCVYTVSVTQSVVKSIIS